MIPRIKNIHFPLVELILLLWLLLPNIILFWVMDIDFLSSIGILTASLQFFFLSALFFKTRKAFFLANLPWAILSGFVSFYIATYRSPLSSGLLQSIFSTDLRETLEQSSRYATMGSIILLIILCYILLSLTLKNKILGLRKLLIAFSLWGIFSYIYLPYISFEIYHRFEISIDTNFYNKSYPINLLNSTYRAINEKKQLQKTKINMPKITQMTKDEPKIFVFVIGETTRAQTFNELSKKNKALMTIPNIISYSNVLAQANYTAAAIPLILTGSVSLPDAVGKADLIDWQNAMGCKTIVISNNNSFNFSDQAAIRSVEGNAGVTHFSKYDHEMLGELTGILSTMNQTNLCITMHMVGSHYDYSARYEKKFEQFPVRGSATDKLRAEYKNTVVMVQDFLLQLIDILKQQQAQSFLVFTSDHGENLLEINNLREHVSSQPTKYELKVPLIFWANDHYKNKHRQQWKYLLNNQKNEVSTGNILPTLLDAMDVSEKSLIKNASLMKKFKSVPRFFTSPDGILHPETDMLIK